MSNSIYGNDNIHHGCFLALETKLIVKYPELDIVNRILPVVYNCTSNKWQLCCGVLVFKLWSQHLKKHYTNETWIELGVFEH